MKDYKRITMREFAVVTGDAIYNRLAELEDKIESGEIVDCKEVVKECLQVLRDTDIPCIYDDFSWGWDNGIDTAIKRLAEKYNIDMEDEE